MNAEDLVIREMAGGDREIAERFFAGLGEESVWMFNSSGANTRRALAYIDGDRETSKFWLAEEKGENGDAEMAGYVFIWNTDKAVVKFGIAVADRWKGRRLGSRLIRHAIDYCRDNGYGGILLSTRFENERAQRLYEKYGFERIGLLDDGKIEYLYILRFDKTEV